MGILILAGVNKFVVYVLTGVSFVLEHIAEVL